MDLSILTKTGYEDGTLVGQPALYGEDATCSPAEAYHPIGLIGRPADADKDVQSGETTNGARVLYWYQGSTMHTVILDDPRATQKLKQLNPGEAMFYSPGQPDTAYAYYASDGTLTVNVPTGTKAVIQTGAGTKIEVNDATVKVGDDSARALVHALEMQTILAAVLAEIAGDISLLTTPPTSIVYAAYAPAKAALLTALQTAISAQLATLPTLKALGT